MHRARRRTLCIAMSRTTVPLEMVSLTTPTRSSKLIHCRELHSGVFITPQLGHIRRQPMRRWLWLVNVSVQSLDMVRVAHPVYRTTPAVVFFPQGYADSVTKSSCLLIDVCLTAAHTWFRRPLSHTITLYLSEMRRFRPPSWQPRTSVVSLSSVRH